MHARRLVLPQLEEAGRVNRQAAFRRADNRPFQARRQRTRRRDPRSVKAMGTERALAAAHSGQSPATIRTRTAAGLPPGQRRIVRRLAVIASNPASATPRPCSKAMDAEEPQACGRQQSHFIDQPSRANSAGEQLPSGHALPNGNRRSALPVHSGRGFVDDAIPAYFCSASAAIDPSGNNRLIQRRVFHSRPRPRPIRTHAATARWNGSQSAPRTARQLRTRNAGIRRPPRCTRR